MPRFCDPTFNISTVFSGFGLLFRPSLFSHERSLDSSEKEHSSHECSSCCHINSSFCLPQYKCILCGLLTADDVIEHLCGVLVEHPFPCDVISTLLTNAAQEREQELFDGARLLPHHHYYKYSNTAAATAAATAAPPRSSLRSAVCSA